MFGEFAGTTGVNYIPDVPAYWTTGYGGYTMSEFGGHRGWDFTKLELNVAPVPEPATMLLLGSGLIGLAGLRRKFKKA